MSILRRFAPVLCALVITAISVPGLLGGLAHAAALPGVVVTTVTTNASSVKIAYQPVPGAKDYRVYDVANPTVVKYAGMIHLNAGAQFHFVTQADGVTPVFPYTSTYNSTGPQTLDVPSTEIEWNRIDDGQPHTLVVQAVDALGPVPPHNLTDAANSPLTTPADWLGADEGRTPDGNISINGQGPSTNTPRPLAQSGGFVVRATPAVRPIPSRPDATQTFLDTFDTAEGATLTPVGSPVNGFNSVNAITYTLNAGTPRAWDILFQGVDTAVTQPRVSAGGYSDTLFDGPTTANLPRAAQPYSHTLYASSSMSPQTPADLSGGKMLHLTTEVDRHLDGTYRWLSFELAPANDPLTNFRADDGLFSGNSSTANATAVNTSNHALWVQLIPGACDATLFEGPLSGIDSRPLARTFVFFSPPNSTSYPACYQPLNWGDNGRGLDNRSRLDLFVTTRRLAIFEDGVLLTQADIPDGGLPFTNAKAYFTHYLFGTSAAGEPKYLSATAPYETYWRNTMIHSDQRHWDNMGFEVLPAAAVPPAGDFSSLASLIHLPASTLPAYLIPSSPTPTVAPTVTPTAQPTNVPSAFKPVYAAVNAGVDGLGALLNTQTAGQSNMPTFGAALTLANGQRGTALLAQYAINGVQLELNRLQTLGVQGVTVDIPYPLLAPWYPDSAKYLAFYTSVAHAVVNSGMRLIVEPTIVAAGSANPGFSPFSFPSFCAFERDQQQITQSIIDSLAPYYMTVFNDPSSTYQLTHYSQFDPSVSTQGALRYINYLLGNAADPTCSANTLTPLRRGATRLGAGQSNWEPTTYAQGYAQIANLDALDLHVSLVISSTAHPFIQTIFTVASYAKQSGKKLTVTEMWETKQQESELTTAVSSTTQSAAKRDTFSFWQSTDQRFLTAMVRFARSNSVDYISPFWSLYFEAYLDYTPGVYDENSSASTLSAQVGQLQANAIQTAGPFTQAGLAYQQMIASAVATSGVTPLPRATVTSTPTPLPTRTPWPTWTATATPTGPCFGRQSCAPANPQLANMSILQYNGLRPASLSR